MYSPFASFTSVELDDVDADADDEYEELELELEEAAAVIKLTADDEDVAETDM